MKNTRKKKEVRTMKNNKLLKEYRKISFQVFMANYDKRSKDYDLINKCNDQMVKIERQLKEQGIDLH